MCCYHTSSSLSLRVSKSLFFCAARSGLFLLYISSLFFTTFTKTQNFFFRKKERKKNDERMIDDALSFLTTMRAALCDTRR